jgi:hypothetical protein
MRLSNMLLSRTHLSCVLESLEERLFGPRSPAVLSSQCCMPCHAMPRMIHTVYDTYLHRLLQTTQTTSVDVSQGMLSYCTYMYGHCGPLWPAVAACW